VTRGRDPVELGSPGITGSLADAPSNTLNADPGDARVAAQLALLPAPWRAADRGLLKATEYFVVAIGMTFAVMITLQVQLMFVLAWRRSGGSWRLWHRHATRIAAAAVPRSANP
jgi:hypothetical protein